MKKSEFKKLVKECVRECIHEVLLESGAISTIVAEVMQGTGAGSNNFVREQKENNSQPQKKFSIKRDNAAIQSKLNEKKKKLLDSIGKESFGGINVFEGTTPAPAARDNTPSMGMQNNPLRDMDPNDEGVDISGIMQYSKVWNTLAKGK